MISAADCEPGQQFRRGYSGQFSDETVHGMSTPQDTSGKATASSLRWSGDQSGSDDTFLSTQQSSFREPIIKGDGKSTIQALHALPV
jgi:hypothetical protein